MRVVPTKTKQAPNVVIPIPFERPAPPSTKGQEQLKFTLRSNPKKEDSETYTLNVRVYGSGTPEEWIQFRKDLERILIGLRYQ